MPRAHTYAYNHAQSSTGQPIVWHVQTVLSQHSVLVSINMYMHLHKSRIDCHINTLKNQHGFRGIHSGFR